jgi:hypothetical protein
MSVGLSSLSHGFTLLEGNTHDRDEPLGDEMMMLGSNGMPFT